MKKIDDYMKLPYKIEIVPDTDEGGYVVSVPDLKGCITTAETLDGAMDSINDAKYAWFMAALEEGTAIPLPSEMENYSGQFKLRIPKTLHRELVMNAKKEGISMNQYCVYLLSKGI